MKPINKHALLSLAVMALASTILAFPACDDDGGKKKSKIDVNLTILQTTDMHNRVAGYGVHNEYSPGTTGNDDVLGGFARLATKTNEIRDAQETQTIPIPVLLLDSGDYTMGTVYDLLWDSDPSPFAYLQYMDYDATTLGNHEFDYNPQRLADMITAAKGATDPFTVPIVASNIVFDGADPDDNVLAALYGAGQTIVPTLVLDQSNGIKVGIIGLLGKTADEYAPNAVPVTFNSDYEDAAVQTAIQGVVDGLRNDDEVDIVVALSHSGIHSLSTTPAGDDITLAENISGIDIILSGHDHEKTSRIYSVRNTVDTSHTTSIVCAGSYTRNLLQLDLEVDTINNRVSGARLTNHTIDDTIEGDDAVTAMVTSWDADANTILESISEPAYTVTGNIATTVPALSGPSSPGDNGLGKLIADSFRYVGTDTGASELTFAGCATGTIRNSFAAGQDISFADLFAMLPLGITWMDDQTPLLPGYPLLKVYLTGAEIWDVCQFNAKIIQFFTLAPSYGEYFVSLSGLQYTYNASYTVTAVNSYAYDDYDCNGSVTAVGDNTTLYPIVIDSYVMAMLLSESIQDLLHGTLVGPLYIDPKLSDGTTLIDESNMDQARLDRDAVTLGVQEYQAWRAFVEYLEDELGGSITTAAYGPGPERINP
ncbi:MAG TPA: 5'-nucleotidase C-terminal domain-containing protein [Spirochaetota bacterium]|nr:5'-nucleotidase C-terminal domain-containing protein [Spirochaetota bacterium]